MVNDEYPINLEFNEITFRVVITMKTNYQLDLSHGNFHELIGFDKKKIITDEGNIGSRVLNLSQDTDILNIHCYLVNSSLVDGVMIAGTQHTAQVNETTTTSF